MFRAVKTLADTVAVGACRYTRPAPQSVTPRVNIHVTYGLGLPTMQPHRLSHCKDSAAPTRDGNAGGTGGGRGVGVLLTTSNTLYGRLHFSVNLKCSQKIQSFFFFFLKSRTQRR